MDITKEEFINLSIEEQMEKIRFYRKRLEPFYDYIFSNKELLQKMGKECIDDPFKLIYYDDQMLQHIIFSSLEYLKAQASSVQIEFLSKIQNEDIFNYLFRYLNIKKQLVYFSHDSILQFLSQVKNKQLFLEIYHTPEIFKRLMEKKFLKQYEISVFFYFHMQKLPLEHQIYILKDLKDKEEYQEQYEILFKEALGEAKMAVLDKIPTDIEGQILYYKLTHDINVKNSFMQNINNKDCFYDNKIFRELLSLYPDFVPFEDLTIVINKTSLFAMTDSDTLKILSEDEDLKKVFKEKILQEEEIEGYHVSKFLPFFEDKEEKEKVISKLSKKDIIYNDDIFEVNEYLQERLASNPDYLKDIEPNRLFTKTGIEKYLPYLSDEAFIINAPLGKIDYRNVSMTNIYSVKGEPIYLEKIIGLIEKNPSLINYINEEYALAWINILDDNSNIYQRFPTSCLTSVIRHLNNPKKRQIIKDEVCRRSFQDQEDFDLEIEDVYKRLNTDERKDFINKVNPKFLLYCYVNSKEDEDLKAILVEKIIQNEKAIFHDNIEGYQSFLQLSNDDVLKVLSKVSPGAIVKLYELSPGKLLEDLFLQNFAVDPYLLCNAQYIDEFVYSLSYSGQETVNNKLQELLNDLKKRDLETYELIKESDSYSLFAFLQRYHKGYFNDSLRYNVFYKILKKYPLITKTINYDILSEEFLSLNSDFLEKIVKYPDLQKRIIDIKTKKSQSYSIFLTLFQKIAQNEARIFEEQLLFILSYFEKNDVIYDYELLEKEIDNLLRYIIVSSKVFPFSKESLDVSNINPLNYDEQIVNTCDEEYHNAQSILDLKNVIFKKYFDITYEDAKTFLFTFDNNIEKLELEDEVISFINNIKLIVNLNDISSLKQIYESMMPRYTINDMLCITSELKKAYTRSISDNFTKNTEKTKILINGEEVEVLDAGLKFSFLVHSTNAYSSMPMIDDNYYKSWNAGKNLSNHGICTALVSDVCLGFPPLKDEEYGVIFGFNHLNENAISNMAPYDLYSMNSDYQLVAQRISKFMDGKGTENVTRHTHNEIVVERMNLDDEKQINIQPDFVVITSEMSENQKQNALMAARQMNNGEGISIIYIDIARIVQDKKTKIHNMLREFTQNKDLTLFKEALSLYESIKCTLFTIEKYDFIKTEEFDDIIQNYINYTHSLEENEKINNLKELEKILNEEKAKFDLVNDTGHRFRKLDINYQEHITRIYDSIISINLEKDEEKLAEYLMQDTQNPHKLSAHDESHMVRVTMLSQKICELLGLDERLVKIVLEAALNHDKAREDDGRGIGHGKLGAQRYKQISTLDENTTNMICAIIEYHEKEDNESILKQIFNEYNIKLEDRPLLSLLCSILKDADALDRVRFTNPKATLDPSKLRLKESKFLLKYAGDLLTKVKDIEKEKEENVTYKA